MKIKPSLAEIQGTQSNLVSLAQEAMEIARLVYEAGGELSPELEKRLEVNSQLLPRKVDGYVYIEERLEAEAAIWKRRKDACAAVQKQFEGKIQQLRDRVKLVMQEMGATEIKGQLQRYKLISHKAPRVVITDPAAIPEALQMKVTTSVPNEDLIKQALLDGFTVPGAELVHTSYVRSYENAEEK